MVDHSRDHPRAASPRVESVAAQGRDVSGAGAAHGRVLATRPVAIVYRRDQRRSSTVRTVVRFVVDSIAAHAEAIAGVASGARR